jgi:hypothetical protein
LILVRTTGSTSDLGALASWLELGSAKGALWLNSAVLYSLRHTSGFALTFNGGFSYWFRNERFTIESGERARTYNAQGPYGRAGISIETPGWFSLQPEFNVFQQIASGDRVTFMTFGIGFHFNHPRIAEAAPAPPPPAPAPAKWDPDAW